MKASPQHAGTAGAVPAYLASFVLGIALLLCAVTGALALVTLPPVALTALAAVHPAHSPDQAATQRRLASRTLAYVCGLRAGVPVATTDEAAALGAAAPYTPDERAHLRDVRSVITTAFRTGIAAALLAAACLFAPVLLPALRHRRTHPQTPPATPSTAPAALTPSTPLPAPIAYRRRTLRTFRATGWVCLALPAGIALMLLLSFDQLFTRFHELLFPQGNWSFPTDSLLITSFPAPYWITLGLLWMLFIALIGVVFMLVSYRYGKKLPGDVTNAAK